MMENNMEQHPNVPQGDELELKELLDRVLAASMTQPLREDLARLLPDVQEIVSQSVASAQKRLTFHVTATGDQLRERLEAECDALRRRVAEHVEESGHELQAGVQREFANVLAKVNQLDDSGASTFQALSARIDVLQETSKVELTLALRELSEHLLTAFAQQHSRSQESLSDIQLKQLLAVQQSLRWHEENLAREERQRLELREFEERVSKHQMSSQRLLRVILLAVVVQWLALALLYFRW